MTFFFWYALKNRGEKDDFNQISIFYHHWRKWYCLKKNVDYSKNGLKILCFNDLENYKGGDAGIEKREKSWTDSEYAVYSLFLTVTPIVLILIIGSLLGKTI